MAAIGTYTVSERVAGAAIVSIVGTFLVLKGFAIGLDRGMLLFLPFSILSGVILGAGKRISIKKLLYFSALIALAGVLTFNGYLIVRTLVNWMRGVEYPFSGYFFVPISGPALMTRSAKELVIMM